MARAWAKQMPSQAATLFQVEINIYFVVQFRGTKYVVVQVRILKDTLT